MVHHYVDLATAINSGVDRRRTVDVFGVLIDCRAPSTTNGNDLRCEIVLADESCVLPNNILKKFSVHSFVSKPSDAIRFRELGDIVRIHRAALIEYSRYGDAAVRQGRLKFYSTVQMWKHEADDFEPILPTNTHQRNGRTPDPIDHYDMRRIRELRKWTKDFFFAQYKSQRPYLRTVTEILNAPCGAAFLTKTFDLICYVHRFAISSTQKDLTMTASDGTGRLKRNIIISSRHTWRTRTLLSGVSFLDYCPSWSIRPQNSSWLLIRDVRVVNTDVGREIELSVSVRTSTLIWNAENAPDVRLAKERYNAFLPNMEANNFITRDLLNLQHTPQTTPKRPRTSDGPNVYNQEQLSHRKENGEEGPYHRTLKAPRLTKHFVGNTAENTSFQHHVADSNRADAGPPMPNSFLRKTTPTVGDRGSIELVPQAVPNAEYTSHKHIGIEPVPYAASNFSPRRGNGLGINLAPHDKVITEHNHTELKVWRISDMVHAFRQVRQDCSEKLFRLAVWARGTAWPRDLRHACRPICANCERGVLMVGSNCDDCGSGVKLWQFMLRLILEERCGGASIESWIIGKDAERFFGLQASDLTTNDEKCDILKNRLRTLHAAINVVDCLVVPYEYEDDLGLYRVACVLKGTRLIT